MSCWDSAMEIRGDSHLGTVPGKSLSGETGASESFLPSFVDYCEIEKRLLSRETLRSLLENISKILGLVKTGEILSSKCNRLPLKDNDEVQDTVDQLPGKSLSGETGSSERNRSRLEDHCACRYYGYHLPGKSLSGETGASERTRSLLKDTDKVPDPVDQLFSTPLFMDGPNQLTAECMEQKEKKKTERLRTEVPMRRTSIADLFFIRTATGPPKAEEELNTQKAISAAKLDKNKTQIYPRKLDEDRQTNRSEQEDTNNNNNNTRETNVGEKINRPAATQKDTKTSNYQGKTDVGKKTTAKRQDRKTNHWARGVQKDTGKTPSASREMGSFLWALVFVAAALMRGCLASDVVECSTKVAKVGEDITAEIRCNYGINFEGITQDIIVKKVSPQSNVLNFHNLLLHCYWDLRIDGRKCSTQKSGAETLVEAGLVGVKLSGLKPDDEGEYECVILSHTPYPNRPCNLSLTLLGNNEAENSQSDEQQEMPVLSVVVPCVVVGSLFLVAVIIVIVLRRRGYLCGKSPEHKGYRQDTGKAAAKTPAQV